MHGTRAAREERANGAASGPRVGALLVRLVRDATELVSLELARARAEIGERSRTAAQILLFGALTAVFSIVSLAAFASAAILWLGRALGSHAVAGVIVGGVLMIAGGAFGGVAFRSVKRVAKSPALPPPDGARRPRLAAGGEEAGEERR